MFKQVVRNTAASNAENLCKFEYSCKIEVAFFETGNYSFAKFWLKGFRANWCFKNETWNDTFRSLSKEKWLFPQCPDSPLVTFALKRIPLLRKHINNRYFQN